MIRQKSVFLSVILLGLVILHLQYAPRALADTSGSSIDSAYSKLMTKPDDINLNLEYADLAISAKDYESAIPPLERILFYNPKLTDVKLKLGTLYYLLGSNQVAKSYLEPLAKSEDEKISFKAREYLQKIGG